MDRHTLEILHLLQDFKLCPTIVGHYVKRVNSFFDIRQVIVAGC